MKNRTVSYKLSFEEANLHYISVEMTVPDNNFKETIIGLPVWTPGSYLVREFPKNIDYIESFQNDKKIKCEKISKSEWCVKNRGKKFTVKYKIYSFRQNVRESFVSLQRATINGPTTYLYVKGMENSEMSVKFKPLRSWKSLDSDLTPHKKNKNEFFASDYEELMDKVTEIGNHEKREFRLHGKDHVIIIVGRGNYNLDQLEEDCRKIVSTSWELFGDLPYEKYYFMLQTSSERGFGGLEHKTCSLMTVPAFGFKDKSMYQKIITLISHEYFHLWNVKRIFPQGLSPFNWEKETYIDLLWVAEGFTSYYESIILLRAGIIDETQYFKTITDRISLYKKTPGRKVQSAAQSSWDAWIKFYRQDEHSINTVVSYYLKGALIALILDITIRVNSKLKYSLDDLMRKLYENSKSEDYDGYSFKDIKKISEDFSGIKMDKFYKKYVYSTDEINFRKFFEMAGLQLISKEVEEEIPWMGFTTFKEKDGTHPVVMRVLHDSPASKSGIYYMDTIIAVNGSRVNENNLQERIRNFEIGETIELTVFRNNFLEKIDISLERKPELNFRIEKRRTSGRKKAMRNMLFAVNNKN